MKIKRNVEPKKWAKGKMYVDYIRIEVERGNMKKKDADFWINVNEKIKADPFYTAFHFFSRDHRTGNKFVPYNS